MTDNYSLEIVLKFGELNGQTMSVELLTEDQKFLVSGVTGKHVFSTSISFPTQIEMHFSGKNQITDTVIDENGKIIKDKYVKIESIAIDGIYLPKQYLQQGIELITNDQRKIVSDYIGFNGKIQIKFDKSNLFYQIADIFRLYDEHWIQQKFSN